MIDSYFRSGYQKLCVDPALFFILRIKSITPQWITVAGLISGIVAAVAIAFNLTILAVALLISSGYFDTLDGSLARRLECSSPQGAALDVVSDRVVEFAVILGLFAVAPQVRGYACLWMLGATLMCITSFLVVAVFTENSSEKSFYYSAGIMERTEAFVCFIAMIILPEWFLELALLYVLLVLITAVIRVYQFVKMSGCSDDKL